MSLDEEQNDDVDLENEEEGEHQEAGMKQIIFTFSELEEKLRDGIVEFEYVKLDGSKRKAKGTTNSDYLKRKTSWRPKGDSISSSKVLAYYDIDKDDWRCVSRRSKITSISK